ncbi:MAG: universal stress protein [Candidatus Methylomirabilales bacterium]
MRQAVKITRIFTPTDFSPAAEVACCLAARLASHLKAGIVLFHAIPGMDLLGEMGRARGKTQVEVLEDLGGRLRGWFDAVVPAEFKGFLPVEVMVVVGEPNPVITPAAKRSGADLIVMATRGRSGLAHLLMGSVAETVLRSVPVPVLALRLGQGTRPLTVVRRILWATDLSPVSEEAWRYALTLADVFAAEVVLMHVVPPGDLPWQDEQPVPTSGSWLEQYLAPLDRELELRQRAVEEQGLIARRKILVGVPAEAIVAEARAEEADLIIVGTRGRSGLPHVLLGSVAAAVIRKAPCPVLAVKVKPNGEVRKEDTHKAVA